MKYLIVVVIAGILFFIFKNKIKRSIINRKKPSDEEFFVREELVYVPVTSSRVFEFAIEIVELGGGKATINVLKKGKKEVTE